MGLKEEPEHQYFPHDIWSALRLSNTLFPRKDSHPSSLNNNFTIDNYKAGNYLTHFIDPFTVTNSLLIHSLLWHISASDRLLTASTISINRSRRCSLFISLLHGLWAFVQHLSDLAVIDELEVCGWREGRGVINREHSHEEMKCIFCVLPPLG